MLIGYARVSTSKQELDGQVLRLKAAGVEKLFTDTASGKTTARPGLAALLDFAREGDTVCVVRLDRLGRSMRDLLGIAHKLKEAKVALWSFEEKLDTDSAAGALIFHVFAALADFERRLIVERTRDGQAAAKANGTRIGRPRADQAKIEIACALVQGGQTPAEAAGNAGVHVKTLYRYLKTKSEQKEA